MISLEKLKSRIDALHLTPDILTVTAITGEDIVQISDPETGFYEKVTREIARSLEAQHHGLVNWLEIKIRDKVD